MCYVGVNMLQRERLGKVSYGDTVAKPQRKNSMQSLKLAWCYRSFSPSGNGRDPSGADMAAPLLTDRGHTHQLIACKRACT